MPSQLTSNVITNVAEWKALEPQWKALFKDSHLPCALSWEWLDSWWEVFGSEYGRPPGGLRILVLQRDGLLIAALPLYLRARGVPPGIGPRIGFMGTGERQQEEIYPEKLDILARDLKAEEFDLLTKALQQVLTSETWDEFDSGFLGSDAPLDRLLKTLTLSGKKFAREVPSPFVDLSQGFENYLEKKSSNSRQQFRRLLRAVEKSETAFSIADNVPQALEYFDELVTLHQAKWTGGGKSGAFASKRTIDFHRRLIERLLNEQRVVLAKLHDSRPLAVLYGFRAGSTFDFYQSGIAAESPNIRSPGITAHLLLMRELAARGISTYDFLAGESTYKEKLANGSRQLRRNRIFKFTPAAGRFLLREIGTRLMARLRFGSVTESEHG